jgi:hypothetical protein
MVDRLARSELQIYLLINVIYLFLFGLFVTFRSPKPQCPHYVLSTIQKPLISKGASQWLFCNVWTNGTSVFEY